MPVMTDNDNGDDQNGSHYWFAHSVCHVFTCIVSNSYNHHGSIFLLFVVEWSEAKDEGGVRSPCCQAPPTHFGLS